MILLFVILAFIAIYGIKFSSYNENYISLESTNAVKGILAVIILFSHMNGYIELPDTLYDNAFSSVLRHLGQLMVAPYLFYSGFGILESVKKKPNYSRSFPRKRILKTLVHFDIAVILYLLTGCIIGSHYPIVNYLTCWIGWESVGNSNWFIFVILLLYVLTYLSIWISEQTYSVEKQKLPLIAFSVTFGAICSWGLLHLAGKDSWWYDTIMTFPLGMWFSIYRESFESLMKKHFSSWLVILSILVLLGAWHVTIGNDHYGICACLFCLAITALLTKVHIGNNTLQWLGAHAFAIYIMQRLPMNIFEHFGWNENPYIFIVFSIPSALIIAWGYNKLLSLADTKIYF